MILYKAGSKCNECKEVAMDIKELNFDRMQEFAEKSNIIYGGV